MLNVLHIIYGADMGGISSFILNYYRYMDKSQIHFDFAMEDDYIGHNGKLLEELGCRFYCLPSKFKIREYYKNIKNIVQQGNYSIVHSHIGFSSYYPLCVAKMAGVKHTIAHAHGMLVVDHSFSNLCRKIVAKCLTPLCTEQYFGCSKDAVFSTFGRKYADKAHIIKNAIDTKKYQFSKKTRDKIREELALSKTDYVIGIIARLTEEKNVDFAIDVLRLVLEKLEVKLLVVGGGPLFDSLKMKCDKMGLSDKTIFLGWRSDVDELLCAMDIVLLPSKHEGFGMAALEAMASGMEVLVSENVPRDLDFSEKVEYLPIGKGHIAEWASEIVVRMEKPRFEKCDEIYDYGYDIVHAVKELERIYYAISRS